MPTPLEYRSALQVVTGAAVGDVLDALPGLSGSPEQQRALLLDAVPSVVDYYSDAAAALGADSYMEARELAAVRSRFTAAVLVQDMTVKLRRGVAWAALPLFKEDKERAAARLSTVIQPAVARPFRDTVIGNRRRDPASIGWRRIARPGACRFCRMLADRGAVYKRDTARFASHNHCHCTCEPVFETDKDVTEASVMQYTASQKNISEKQKARLRDYLDSFYGPDDHAH